MTSTINLDSKEVRKIIALFLGIPEEQVIPNRYSFSVKGMTAESISSKLNSQN
jgi:lambda repressor-like predicted transcriptional regulator